MDIGVMIQEIFQLLGEIISNAFSGGLWQGLSDLLSKIVAGL